MPKLFEKQGQKNYLFSHYSLENEETVCYEILSLRPVNSSVEGLDWLQTEVNIKVLLYFTF